MVHNIETIVKTKKCRILLIKNFLNSELHNELLDELKNINYNQEIINIYGKKIKSPRLSTSYGDDNITYKYSGKIEKPNKWTKSLEKINESIIKFIDDNNLYDNNKKFNFVLINKYRNQYDSIGLHSDNEKDILKNSPIASLSFGDDRNFVIVRNKDNKKIDIQLDDNSLLLMLGETQKYYKHSVPKVPELKEVRYNLTFRHIINSDN